VLRRLVSDLPDVSLVHADVAALGTDQDHVTGVVTAEGTVHSADLVVDATGPRTALAARIRAAAGAVVPEEADDTGIVYSTRFYRLAPDAEPPPTAGPIAGDLGYLKYAVFTGDNRTFSITFGLWSDDDDFRVLLREGPFARAAAAIPAVAPWLADGFATPITDVGVMARLVNRRRRFVVDGRPLVTGLVAVGDASVCTNPLYGRGCSLATVHAFALAATVADIGLTDPTGFVLAFDDTTRRLLDPWYRSALLQDNAARALRAGTAEGADAGAGPVEFIRDGVLPAARVNPNVWRAFVRTFNLLDEPDAMMANPDVVEAVMEAFAARDLRPPPDPIGPSRDEMLDLLADG
jgi:flavin-dependent dehydrogenase